MLTKHTLDMARGEKGKRQRERERGPFPRGRDSSTIREERKELHDGHDKTGTEIRCRN